MDQLILDVFIGLRVTWLSPVIILFTQLTGPTLMFVYALVWGLLRKSATAPIAVGLANLISHFLKRAFERPRPNTAEHLVVETNFSFLSVHAVGVEACASAVLDSVVGWWELTLWVIALLVGLSRLYVGVHWPSDVLAGWAIGALTSVVVFTSWNLLQRR